MVVLLFMQFGWFGYSLFIFFGADTTVYRTVQVHIYSMYEYLCLVSGPDINARYTVQYTNASAPVVTGSVFKWRFTLFFRRVHG